MAKNKVYSQINQYANREEEIRKAKGNPNKNNHAKKKNSNYGGYSTSAGSYMAQKLAERGKQQERVKLPMWLNITLIVLFAAIAVTLILQKIHIKEKQHGIQKDAEHAQVAAFRCAAGFPSASRIC